jgi:hypothetical protein
MQEKAEIAAFCASCKAILDSHQDQNETIYVLENLYLQPTLVLNTYCEFCATAHSKFKIR